MAKLLCCLLFLMTSFLPGLPSQVRAQAPQAGTQVPGYYRMMLGDVEITALYDGDVQLDTAKLLKNISEADLQQMLARMFMASTKVQTAVNGYLINTGEHLVLVDTGAAKLFGPSLGNIIRNLQAAGYEPAQVDTVIITHLHPDHMGGLSKENGQLPFPKAKIFVGKEESDYWLAMKSQEEAPAEKQSYFQRARDIAAPYQAAGTWETFTEGSTIVPGIQAVRAFGHTPGHTAYEVVSDGQKLLIWGDVVHAHAIQFARPGVSIEFDSDQQQAISTRRRLMEAMAVSKSLVAGMHLPFPGIGHVRKDTADSYSWIPVDFAPLPRKEEQ